jgi:ribonuclease R
VHISELGSDYFHFDAVRHQLLGERTGQRYRIGDRIGVQVVRVDLSTSRIDFVLAPGTQLKGPLAASGARGKSAAAEPGSARGAVDDAPGLRAPAAKKAVRKGPAAGRTRR